jgi:putative hemolysin
MIGRVFDYARLSVRDVMTPHTQIVGLEIDTSIPDALQVARESGYSRFPVYRQTLDSILGYVHVKDLLWAAPDTRLDQVLREMVFIPEGAGLPQASSQLTRARRYMGIVLDEFGGTDGLVTLEDIMEVVVGEIEDEYGPVATVPERGRQGEWCFSGGLPISETGNLLEINFEPGGMYTTLAGFIMAELGGIPEIGDQIRYKGYSFQVEDMEGFRITSIRVQRLKEDDV